MPIQRKPLPVTSSLHLQISRQPLYTAPDVDYARGYARHEKASEPQFLQSQPRTLISPSIQEISNPDKSPTHVGDLYHDKGGLPTEPPQQLGNVNISSAVRQGHANRDVSYNGMGGSDTAGLMTPKSMGADHHSFESKFGDIPFTADPEFEDVTDDQDINPATVKKNPKLTAALEDASVFLGGLINHPTESNKHFTMLRHGHGLVYYKGPTTSIAVTTFADTPLPLDRRYWLQMKGWTGMVGMKAKALLRTNASWINVTPAREAQAEDLVALDERAWQRDIKKFQKKAPKQVKSHLIRETAVLRVPFEAVDGYFRVVMTQADNRSPLCTGPVFRVASTSMSASSIKGASLGTLPIELGINILQFAARQTATNTISPFAGSIKQQVVGMLPSVVQSYGQTAYSLSGAEGEIDTLNENYDTKRIERAEQVRPADEQYTPMTRPDVVGDLDGPAAPFPIRLQSTITQGTGQGLRGIGMPTANLRDVPEEKLLTLSGVYFGWVFVQPKDPAQADLHSSWRHAIITVSPHHHHHHHHNNNKGPGITAKKLVRVYIIHDYSGETFFDSKMSVVIMGHLRPTIQFADREAVLSEIVRDIQITRDSLARDRWGPDDALQRIKTARSQRSFTDRYVDTRTAVQRRVDGIPVHKLGIRSEGAGMNDRGLYGNGGIYVVRDAR